MNEPTLESLARRVEALERAVGLQSARTRSKDWRRVVGMFGDSEFMRQVDAEGQAIREAEREEARRAEPAAVILLDTDHVTVLKYPAGERGQRLAQKLSTVPSEETIAVAVVTVEEQMRGWLAAIAKERASRRQVGPYRELANLFDFFAEFSIVLFDDRAADQFDALRGTRLRLGTMDLKIAATALVNQALLLSANRRDFERVPGLRVENWLE